MADTGEYDIIIVGGGGAGLCAAIEAHDTGASVALLEAGQKLGGSTFLSEGAFMAAGTSAQREKGIEDSPDAMFEYYMTLNQHRLEASCVRALCDNGADAFEWLRSFGVNFDKLFYSGVDSVPRGHLANGGGAAITEALEAQVSKRGIDVALNTRVQELIVDQETGRVSGVLLDSEPVYCKAVIICTGGFGANPDLVKKYYPDADAQGDWAWYFGSSGSQGDGLAMGKSAGAEIAGYNQGLLLTTPNFFKAADLFPGWLIFVNREGRRFINEMASYAVMGASILAQTGSSCFAIFDNEAKQAFQSATQYGNPYLISHNWVSDEVDRQVKTGKVFKADTLAELEAHTGIRPGSLVGTMEQYNADTAAGKDSQFFKTPSVMKPVSTPPYYIAELKPSIIALTSTGLRINAGAQVLNEQNQIIPGLYAAGETTSGVMGERYVGGGNSIANAIIFGRIAGREAVKER